MLLTFSHFDRRARASFGALGFVRSWGWTLVVSFPDSFPKHGVMQNAPDESFQREVLAEIS